MGPKKSVIDWPLRGMRAQNSSNFSYNKQFADFNRNGGILKIVWTSYMDTVPKTTTWAVDRGRQRTRGRSSDRLKWRQQKGGSVCRTFSNALSWKDNRGWWTRGWSSECGAKVARQTSTRFGLNIPGTESYAFECAVYL